MRVLGLLFLLGACVAAQPSLNDTTRYPMVLVG
jgi:hypothetical protein